MAISILQLRPLRRPFVLAPVANTPTLVGTWGETVVVSAGSFDRSIDAGRGIRNVDAAKHQNRYLDAGRDNGTI